MSPNKIERREMVIPADVAAILCSIVMLPGTGGSLIVQLVPVTVASIVLPPKVTDTAAPDWQKPHTIATDGSICRTIPSPKMEAKRNVSTGGTGEGGRGGAGGGPGGEAGIGLTAVTFLPGTGRSDEAFRAHGAGALGCLCVPAL